MNHSEHSSVPACSGRVLIVDDNDPIRRMLRLALETFGFEVLEADTQLELQRRLALIRPDALLLNLHRSVADGFNLLVRMRARHSLQSVPIVFLVASADDDFHRRAVRAGADWFGVRPVPMRALQTQLVDLIRNGRPVERLSA